MSGAARIANHVRLGAFPVAYGLSGVLIGGTLNRVMIAELRLPATLVAVLFALPLLVSPLRLWPGYRSDGFPILGRRREPYLLLGALLIGAGVAAIANLTVRTAATPAAFVPGAIAAFLLYGVGMLGSVVEFTTPVRAGLLMGVWGVANMLGHAAGSLMGGVVVDTMRLATGSALAAYTPLFAFEVVMLVLALTLRLQPAAMQASGEVGANLR